ncbi:hypothetical protein RI845_03140 [Thalassotalea nanhaiensis]|uniref:Glycoside hydrolase family 42 N-terminal domain-containing protein n=1 Tax=Thalassotalea nanhaiensis TaxID=3065648 RepID=A0ABY9TK42_9GAMM|nr:hypothetical protein RI845_03140 [Colwelliaceae bacterium SQ345]
MKNLFILLALTLALPVIAVQELTSDIINLNTLTAESYKTNNVQTKRTADGIEITIQSGQKGSIVFKPSVDYWDLTQWVFLSIELENKTQQQIRFDPVIMYESPKRQKQTQAKSKNQHSLAHIGFLKPLESLIYNNVLIRDQITKADYPYKSDFPGMKGIPNGVIMIWEGVDAKHINGLKIAFPAKGFEQKILLKRIFKNRPALPYLYTKDKTSYFPFINKYGQYKHDTWPGKITDDTQFKQAIEKEQKDLAKHPKSIEWDRFGGFANGPKFEATGHFRTQKIEGKWWIINPDGNLFWSSGVNGAGKLTVGTPTKNREHFFEGIPNKSPNNQEYFKGQTYYHGLKNLHRKYGDNSEGKYLDISLDRMKSWGLNTLGGWSNEDVASSSEKKKLPYTVFIGATKPEIHEKFPDVFDPKWKDELERKVKQKAALVKNDPYFFGFFINNEIHWGTPQSIAASTLAKGQNSAGKKVYIALLKDKLKNIETFNKMAGSNFKSWQALLTTKVKKNKVKHRLLKDINVLHYTNMTDVYFKTSKELIDTHAPGKLYLGCRWHGNHKNHINISVAAKYVDILSFNAYENEVEHYPYPAADIDKPFIISEFNFGALDAGKFFTGLGYASNQRNRGEKYKNFVEGALRNPRIVGAHWFMWANSTTAGRGNGENANCGLVSMTDQIYYELISYMRETNYRLYQYRLNEK